MTIFLNLLLRPCTLSFLKISLNQWRLAYWNWKLHLAFASLSKSMNRIYYLIGINQNWFQPIHQFFPFFLKNILYHRVYVKPVMHSCCNSMINCDRKMKRYYFYCNYSYFMTLVHMYSAGRNVWGGFPSLISKNLWLIFMGMKPKKKFQTQKIWLVLGSVELIDVKGIDVDQLIWSWGCPA